MCVYIYDLIKIKQPCITITSSHYLFITLWSIMNWVEGRFIHLCNLFGFFSFSDFFSHDSWGTLVLTPYSKLTTPYTVEYELPVCHFLEFVLLLNSHMYLFSIGSLEVCIIYAYTTCSNIDYCSRLLCFVENTQTVSKNLGCKTKHDDNPSTNQVDVLIPEVIQVLFYPFS